MKKYFVILLFLVSQLFGSAQSLHPLGKGVQTNGTINAMAYDSIHHLLYAAGYFQNINGTPANNIGVWDGASWHPLGAGTSGMIYSLKIIGTDLFVGGYFEQAGGITVNDIARWDGTAWHSLGSGILFNAFNYVRSVESYQGMVFVGGSFNFAGGIAANGIAFWDGNQWSTFGAGFDQLPVDLLRSGNRLFAYGRFTRIDTLPCNSLAQFDGSAWSPVPGMPWTVLNAASIHDTLYTVTSNNQVWKQNSPAWDVLQTFSSPISFMTSVGDTLYVSTDTSLLINSYSYDKVSLYRFDSTRTPVEVAYSLTSSFFREAFTSMASDGQHLYAAGSFANLQKQSIVNLAVRTDTSWSQFAISSGGGYIDSWHSSSVTTLFYDTTNQSLIAGGSFYFAGDSVCRNIARWDGSDWHAMGDGFNSRVLKVVSFNGSLYAAGYFNRSGSRRIMHIARWDGSDWQPVGGGSNSTIFDLIVFNNELYAGGSFDTVDGVYASRIARFDGFAWQPVADNVLDDDVTSLAVYQGAIAASANFGFYFTFSGNADVATVSGGHWTFLGTTVGGCSIANINGTLYRGGSWPGEIDYFNGTDFVSANLTSQNGLVPIGFHGRVCATASNEGFYVFDGAAWTYTGYIQPYAFAPEDSNHIYAGGFFPSLYQGTNEVVYNNIGRIDWELPQATISADRDTLCDHGYVTFTATTDDIFSRCQWHFPNALPDTSSQPVALVQYQVPGTYDVYLVITNLVGTDTIHLNPSIFIRNCTVATDEIYDPGSLTVYPNPAGDQIRIDGGSTEITSVQVINPAGICQNWIQSTQQSSLQLPVTDLAPGTYLLVIRTENGTWRKRIVKL